MTRIVDVETHVVNAQLRNWVFVKVITDQPGLIGWGEATLEWKAQAVVGAVKDLRPLIIGEDPLRTEYLWQLLSRGHFFQGGAVTMSALAGVDQALWDIKAKELAVPCWQLLGGAVRHRVRMYDHLGGGDASIVYGAASGTGFAEAALKSVADGFTALKILAVPMGGGLPDTSQVRHQGGASTSSSGRRPGIPTNPNPSSILLNRTDSSPTGDLWTPSEGRD